MKKSSMIAACLLGVMLLGTSAWAGYKGIWTVVVDPTNRTAYGALGSVRNTADSTQYLGCTTYSYSSGTTSMNCWARDPNGVYVSCSSSVPALVAAAQALTSDGYIYFTWDASGNCTYMVEESGSYFAPKNP